MVVDGVEFTAVSTASHQPAVLCVISRLLGSMQIFSNDVDGLYPTF